MMATRVNVSIDANLRGFDLDVGPPSTSPNGSRRVLKSSRRTRRRISRQQRRRTQQTKARPSSNSVTPPPAATISNVQPAGSKYGEDLRFQTSVKELFPNRANYKCFLSAAMTRLAARAGVTM